MKARLTIIGFILYIQTSFAQNQDTSSKQLIDKLQRDIWTASLKSPEKFYVVTDRPWYLPGEEIWFKVFITTNGLPVTGTGVLYINLCDSTGKVFYKKITPVDDNGVSYGMIKLSSELKKGWYSLGVQTEWNRNFNNGFEKLVYISEKGEIPLAISFSNFSDQKNNTVQFFPEGGNFVAGLQNHFGVMAVDKNGEPATVKGFIVSDDDTLAKFETSTIGLSEFTLSAITNNLPVNVYWPDGNKTTQMLPQLQPAGITLQASVIGKKLFYKIESFPAWFTSTSEILFIITVHDEIVFSKTFYNTADLTSFSDFIPINEFPNGTINLRLYTNDGKEIAKREIYNDNEKKILIEKKEIGFEPKARNELEITLPDTLSGTYSVSITDADLSDELITVANENRNNVKEMNLHLLARTDPFNSPASPKYSYQSGLNISGRIYNAKTQRPVSNTTINFFPKNSGFGSFLLSDSLDEKGDFELKNLYVEDSMILCWNINGMNINELNKTKLKLNNNWFDSMTTRTTALQNRIIKTENEKNDKPVIDALKRYNTVDSLEKKKIKVLPEVNIFAQRQKRIEELDKTYAGTSLFGGRLGEAFVFDMEEEKTFYPDIFSYLQGRIPSLKISGPPYNPTLKYRFGDIWSGGSNVAVFVGENFIQETSDIASIPVSEIAYVKAFKQPYAYILSSGVGATGPTPFSPGTSINNGKTRTTISGSGAIGGVKIALVIVIYLKKGPSKIPSTSLQSAFQSFSVKGLSLPTNFLLPDYTDKKEMENIPDKRITLYWNPEINFERGKAKIIFYNNDFSKRYLVKLDGINELGEIVSFRQVIGNRD